jgi:hypothetical protein
MFLQARDVHILETSSSHLKILGERTVTCNKLPTQPPQISRATAQKLVIGGRQGAQDLSTRAKDSTLLKFLRNLQEKLTKHTRWSCRPRLKLDFVWGGHKNALNFLFITTILFFYVMYNLK